MRIRLDKSRRSSRRAFSVIYVGAAMLMLLGFVSLAVDLGRVRTTKAQLMTAADAAALAGLHKLPEHDLTAARSDAAEVAFSNRAYIKQLPPAAVDLDEDNDIFFGFWRDSTLDPTQKFTPVGQQEPITKHVILPEEANAVQVFARRVKSRDTQLRLIFAGAVGKQTVDVTAEAIAKMRGVSQDGFGIVGLDWVKINGTTRTDSYDPNIGKYGGTNVHQEGSVASNGTITLVGKSTINGDARPGIDHWVDMNQNSTVTGWIAPLDTTLTYKADAFAPTGIMSVLPPANLNNKNEFITKGSDFTFPSGQHSYTLAGWSQNGNTVTISGGTTLWITGDFSMSGNSKIKIVNATSTPSNRVAIYVNGNFDQGGTTNIANQLDPGALYVSLTHSNTHLKASSELNAHLYAPLSDVTLTGNAQNPPHDFSGWVVGKTITLNGNSQIHYDESLSPPDKPYHGALMK